MARDKTIHRRETVSFIVRCWPHATRGTSWRGEVEHVKSGRKKAFSELGQALKILQDLLDLSSSGEAESRPKG